jgi:hypothetical protein
MSTPYSSIFDLFMMQVTDYKLNYLYETSLADFENYLLTWLKFAIGDFVAICADNLEDRDDTLKIFNPTLATLTQTILAELMVKYWLQKEIQNITQMNVHVQDRDFKFNSEAQNLKSKSDYLITVKESLSQRLLTYGYNKNNWANWQAGIFSSSTGG